MAILAWIGGVVLFCVIAVVGYFLKEVFEETVKGIVEDGDKEFQGCSRWLRWPTNTLLYFGLLLVVVGGVAWRYDLRWGMPVTAIAALMLIAGGIARLVIGFVALIRNAR